MVAGKKTILALVFGLMAFPAYGGQLADKVTAYIHAAVHAGLHTEPLAADEVVEALLAEPGKIKPSQLDEISKGLAAAYPDFSQRATLEGPVINEQGHELRLKIALALLKAQALEKPAHSALAVRAFAKLLSLEPHQKTRGAVITALKPADKVSMEPLVAALIALAEAGDDELEVAEFEKERAGESLGQIALLGLSFGGCGERLNLARFLKRSPTGN